MLKRFIILLLLLLLSASALAQYDHPRKATRERSVDSRYGRYEVTLVIPYQNGASVTGEAGSSLDIDSSLGWGFSLGWNWTEHVNLSYRLMINKPDYVATLIPDDLVNEPVTINYKMTKMTNQFNATYNILTGSFTPFIAAGVGYTKLDSNIPSGLDQAACWWDPWYGYICATDWSTYSTSEFSYNVGAGVRWDYGDFFFAKAAYSKQFINAGKVSIDFDNLIVELGLMF